VTVIGTTVFPRAGGDEPPPPLETGVLSYANWRSSANKLIDPTTRFCPVRKGHCRLLSLRELATCFQNSARG